MLQQGEFKMMQDTIDSFSKDEQTAMEYAAHMGIEHFKHNLKKSDIKNMTKAEWIAAVKLMCMNYDSKRLNINNGQDIADFIPF
jgi:hypothetical protein